MDPHPFQPFLRARRITQADVTRETGVLPARLSEVFCGRVKNFSKKDALRLHRVYKEFPLYSLLYGRPEEGDRDVE